MADDLGWEAMTLEQDVAYRVSPRLNSFSSQPSLCDSGLIGHIKLLPIKLHSILDTRPLRAQFSERNSCRDADIVDNCLDFLLIMVGVGRHHDRPVQDLK